MKTRLVLLAPGAVALAALTAGCGSASPISSSSTADPGSTPALSSTSTPTHRTREPKPSAEPASMRLDEAHSYGAGATAYRGIPGARCDHPDTVRLGEPASGALRCEDGTYIVPLSSPLSTDAAKRAFGERLIRESGRKGDLVVGTYVMLVLRGDLTGPQVVSAIGGVYVDAPR